MIEALRRDKVSLILLAGAVVLAAIGVYRLTTKAETTVIVRMGDGPLYETIDSLRAEADLVVRGKVGEILERYEDPAGNPEVDERSDPLPALKKVIVELSVTAVLAGETSRSNLPIVVTDSEGVLDESIPRLQPGQDIVVFLFDVPAEEGSAELRSRDEEFGGLFGVVGGNQGVFDVAGQEATSRADVSPLDLNPTRPLGD